MNRPQEFDYYVDFIDEKVSPAIFVKQEDISHLCTVMSDRGYVTLDMRQFSAGVCSEYQKRLIELTGYLDNGAESPNVFYELISDLRWLNQTHIAIIAGDVANLCEGNYQYTLNCMLEGAVRLRIEQNRHLLVLVTI